MSAQPEFIGASKSAERAEAAPEIEYRMVTHDSLSMFLAAIGGAVLGMLLTLLVLALVNGGTLTFSGPRITQLEAYVSRINENLGAVSANIDLVSEQAATLQQQLGSVEGALRAELATQTGDIESLNTSVETLQVTRQQFGVFVEALNSALAEMQTLDPSAASATDAAASVEPAEESAAPAADTTTETTDLPAPQSAASADVAANALAVLLFVDENSDGVLDEGETNLIGLPVTLQTADGTTVATAESGDAGVVFSDLTSGDYRVTVDDTLGYTLSTAPVATVTVDEGAAEGTVIYIPVTAE
jgi:hypothetical protein